MIRVVFAGAGFTALEAAPIIKKALAESAVTIITKHRHRQLHFPSELLNNHVDSIDVKLHCQHYGLECLIGAITWIDREHKVVHVGEAMINYDYLVLDMGSEPLLSFYGAEHAIPCNNRHAITELKHHVIGQFVKAKQDYSPDHRTIVVAGATIQGLETVTELKTFIEHLAERHLFFSDEFTLVLVTEGQQLPTKLKTILEDKDIEVYESSVQKYLGNGVQLKDRTIESHTLVIAMSKPNSFLQRLGVVMDGDACLVNDYLQTTDPHVFAVGGCGTRTRKLPITALHRHDASVLANNIISIIKAKKMKKFVPGRKPFTVTTGNGRAFLSTRFFTVHGTWPHAIRQHFASRHRSRIQNP